MNVGTTLTEENGLTAEMASLLHDLRNPLSAIYSSAELLAETELAAPQARRLTQNISAASRSMKELIESFLGRYRGTAAAREPWDLRELIAMAAAKVRDLAEARRVEIVQDVPEGLVVTLDSHRMQQVFVNLMVNALEAMPEEGVVRISAVPQRHSVLITVRDSGPGIHPELRGRLFREFATAGKVNGLGLGLAFSRKAVADHGGEIWAESSSDGACFVIRLARSA